MKLHTSAELKEISESFAEDLKQSKISFLIVFYPSDESEPVILRDGEMQSQIALLDNLQEEICDEAIQVLDENTRMMDAASKTISELQRRN